MRKIIIIFYLMFYSFINAQFSNANEFISFAKKDFAVKKNILTKTKWKLVKTKKDYSGEASVYQLNLDKNRVWDVALRKVKSPNSGKTIYDTELKIPNEEYYMMNDWFGQLVKEGYEFEMNQYRGESIYKSKDWRIIVTMRSNEYETLTKINVLSVK